MTAEQRNCALERANQTRAAIAQVRAVVRAGGRRGGARRAIGVIEAGDSRVKVLYLLRSIPGVGENTARNMLVRAQIQLDARVSSRLTDRQRAHLVGQLVKRAHGQAWE